MRWVQAVPDHTRRNPAGGERLEFYSRLGNPGQMPMNIHNAGGSGGGFSKTPALSEIQSLRLLQAAGLIWPRAKLRRSAVCAAPPSGG